MRWSCSSSIECESAVGPVAAPGLEDEPVRTCVGLDQAARAGVGVARVHQVSTISSQRPFASGSSPLLTGASPATSSPRCGTGPRPERPCGAAWFSVTHAVRPERNQYDYGKGPVAVHTPATLARELKAEAKRPRELDGHVADAVAKLSAVSG